MCRLWITVTEGTLLLVGFSPHLVPRFQNFFVLGVILLAINCGGGSSGSPTSPSGQFPNVAGTYTGQLTFTIDGQFGGNIPSRLVAVQSGSEVTITSRVTIDGTPIDLNAVTGNINRTGFFTATASGSSSGPIYDQTCGYIVAISSSLTFSGSTVQFAETDTTDYCGTWRF